MDIKRNIGRLARLGDVWYQIMDARTVNKVDEYLLYSRENWVKASWIKQIKDK